MDAGSPRSSRTSLMVLFYDSGASAMGATATVLSGSPQIKQRMSFDDASVAPNPLRLISTAHSSAMSLPTGSFRAPRETRPTCPKKTCPKRRAPKRRPVVCRFVSGVSARNPAPGHGFGQDAGLRRPDGPQTMSGRCRRCIASLDSPERRPSSRIALRRCSPFRDFRQALNGARFEGEARRTGRARDENVPRRHRARATTS